MKGTKVREQRIIGDPSHIANVLNTKLASGELVSAAEPVAVAHPETGKPAVMVIVRLLDRELPVRADASRVTSWRRALWAWLVRNRLPIAVTLAVLGALAGVAYLVYLLVQVVISHLALIVGVLVAAGAAWFLLGRAGVCPGLHCPGCRHNH